MEQQFSAGIVVYRVTKECQLQYLLLHYVQGHWDFPKGHLEQGETNLQAAARELYEETGLTAHIESGFKEKIGYYLFVNNVQVHKTVTFFVGACDSNDVVLSHEHIDYAWLSFEEATPKLTYQNARQVLAVAHIFLTNS